MAATDASSPFAKGKRITLIRTVGIWAAVILVISGGFYYYTRSHQSDLLIITPKDGASVTLNGVAAQVKNDPRGILIPVYAGRYRLVVTNADKQQFTQDVTIPSDTTLSIRPVFSLTSPLPDGTDLGAIDYVRATPDQKTLYYLGDNRTVLYRMEIANRVAVPLTNAPLSGVSDVEWSNDPSIALIVQTDGLYLQEIPSFDFLHQRLVKIATNEVLSPVWDPNDNTRIAAAYFSNAGEKSLVLADQQFQSMERVADLSQFTNPKIVWSPDSRYIAVINRSSDPSQNNVWVYTLADGSFKALTTAGSILDADFSPDGNTVLYESLDSGTHNLHTRAVGGTQDNQATLPGTVTESAWKDDSNFYVVPQGSQTNFILQNINGGSSTIPYSGPTTSDINGLFYFDSSNTLVFYTQTAVYTIDIQ